MNVVKLNMIKATNGMGMPSHTHAAKEEVTENFVNPRIFSVNEANLLVPKLDELTTRLLLKKSEMQKKHDQILVLDLIAGEKVHDTHSTDGQEYISKSAELEALVLSFEDDILEINHLGCYLRDINKGAIDFFSILNSQLVYLNWQRGELEVSHYHDVDSHFTKRKAIGAESI